MAKYKVEDRLLIEEIRYFTEGTICLSYQRWADCDLTFGVALDGYLALRLKVRSVIFAKRNSFYQSSLPSGSPSQWWPLSLLPSIGQSHPPSNDFVEVLSVKTDQLYMWIMLYTYVIAWFAIHYPILFPASSLLDDDLPLLCRYADMCWEHKYFVETRRVAGCYSKYAFFINLPTIEELKLEKYIMIGVVHY